MLFGCRQIDVVVPGGALRNQANAVGCQPFDDFRRRLIVYKTADRREALRECSGVQVELRSGVGEPMPSLVGGIQKCAVI
jgi:hypothetical protein